MDENNLRKGEATKLKLANSIMKLMFKRSIDHITISDITEDAGVTRMTFYRHFQDKYDLVDWIYRTQAVDFLSLVGEGKTWIEAVIAKCDMIRNNPNFYREAYRQQWFIESFTDITSRLYYDAVNKNNYGRPIDKDLEFAIDFYVGACVKKTGEWINSGCKQSSKELSIQFLDCIPEKLRKYILTDADLEYIERNRLRIN